jgi:hypothetical protein
MNVLSHWFNVIFLHLDPGYIHIFYVLLTVFVSIMSIWTFFSFSWKRHYTTKVNVGFKCISLELFIHFLLLKSSWIRIITFPGCQISYEYGFWKLPSFRSYLFWKKDTKSLNIWQEYADIMTLDSTLNDNLVE